MTGTLGLPLPGFVARRLPPDGLHIGRLVLLPKSLRSMLAEHERVLLKARALADACRLIPPRQWREAVDRIEAMAEERRHVDLSEMPGTTLSAREEG